MSDKPISVDQQVYLDTLASEAGEKALDKIKTSEEAAAEIERLEAKNGVRSHDEAVPDIANDDDTTVRHNTP